MEGSYVIIANHTPTDYGALLFLFSSYTMICPSLISFSSYQTLTINSNNFNGHFIVKSIVGQLIIDFPGFSEITIRLMIYLLE